MKVSCFTAPPGNSAANQLLQPVPCRSGWDTLQRVVGKKLHVLMERELRYVVFCTGSGSPNSVSDMLSGNTGNSPPSSGSSDSGSSTSSITGTDSSSSSGDVYDSGHTVDADGGCANHAHVWCCRPSLLMEHLHATAGMVLSASIVSRYDMYASDTSLAAQVSSLHICFMVALLWSKRRLMFAFAGILQQTVTTGTEAGETLLSQKHVHE